MYMTPKLRKLPVQLPEPEQGGDLLGPSILARKPGIDWMK
jgi:hypothetical protein